MSLDIITVVSYDREYFELNYNLTKNLNKDFDHKWIVVENKSDEAHGNYIPNIKKPKLNKENIEYFKGIDQKGENSRVIKKNGTTYTLNPKRNVYHAKGLSIGVEKSNSKYLLIIDPDFFVIKKNWIKEIINYMEINNIDIFSSPYHPVKDWIKPRFSPCVYFLLINTEKIKKKNLNFLPPDPNELLSKKKIFKNKISSEFIIKTLIFSFGILFGDRYRYQIGKLGDVGFELLNTAINNKIKFEFTSPAIKKIKDLKLRRLLFDFILPDNYKLVYKNNNFSYQTFKDFNYYNFREIGCQEYFWKKVPFAFHLRGSIKPFDNKINELNSILNKFLETT